MNNNNIYQKLQTVQNEIGQLAKTETNKFQKYKYLTEYQILTVLNPLLAKTKLILLFSDEITPTKYAEGSVACDEDNMTNLSFKKEEKEWVVKYLKKAVLINSEKPEETLTCYFWACGQNTDIAKAKGSAETYAIKYFLIKFFLIPTSDDLDPDKFGEKTEKSEVKELTSQKKEQADEILAKRNSIIPCGRCKENFTSMHLKWFGVLKLCDSCFDIKKKKVYGN